MSFSQSSSPTLMKEQYQKKENEKQRIIEKLDLNMCSQQKEEQDYATDVIKIISEQFSEDLITKTWMIWMHLSGGQSQPNVKSCKLPLKFRNALKKRSE